MYVGPGGPLWATVGPADRASVPVPTSTAANAPDTCLRTRTTISFSLGVPVTVDGQRGLRRRALDLGEAGAESDDRIDLHVRALRELGHAFLAQVRVNAPLKHNDHVRRLSAPALLLSGATMGPPPWLTTHGECATEAASGRPRTA